MQQFILSKYRHDNIKFQILLPWQWELAWLLVDTPKKTKWLVFFQNSKWSKIEIKHNAKYNRFSKAAKWFIDQRQYLYIYYFHLVTAFCLVLQLKGLNAGFDKDQCELQGCNCIIKADMSLITGSKVLADHK